MSSNLKGYDSVWNGKQPKEFLKNLLPQSSV